MRNTLLSRFAGPLLALCACAASAAPTEVTYSFCEPVSAGEIASAFGLQAPPALSLGGGGGGSGGAGGGCGVLLIIGIIILIILVLFLRLLGLLLLPTSSSIPVHRDRQPAPRACQTRRHERRAAQHEPDRAAVDADGGEAPREAVDEA